MSASRQEQDEQHHEHQEHGGPGEGDSVAGDIEVVLGGRAADRLQASDSGTVLEGADGSDTLIGGNGNDILDGDGRNGGGARSEGNDTLMGGGGDDILYGDGGTNSLDGGTGNDLILDGSFNGVNPTVPADLPQGASASRRKMAAVSASVSRGVRSAQVGVAATSVKGGAGNDRVVGTSIRSVDCGSGTDSTMTPKAKSFKGCEKVCFFSRYCRPSLKKPAKKLVVRKGKVAFTVICPTENKTCVGSLTLTARKTVKYKSGKRTKRIRKLGVAKYKVKSGNRKVSVKLSKNARKAIKAKRNRKLKVAVTFKSKNENGKQAKLGAGTSRFSR